YSPTAGGKMERPDFSALGASQAKRQKQRAPAATRQKGVASCNCALFIPHDSRDLLGKGGLRYDGAVIFRRADRAPGRCRAGGGLRGGKDRTGRFQELGEQSSFRMVPMPRLLVNSELLVLSNGSR